jgi:hypothetical protein
VQIRGHNAVLTCSDPGPEKFAGFENISVDFLLKQERMGRIFTGISRRRGVGSGGEARLLLKAGFEGRPSSLELDE